MDDGIRYSALEEQDHEGTEPRGHGRTHGRTRLFSGWRLWGCRCEIWAAGLSGIAVLSLLAVWIATGVLGGHDGAISGSVQDCGSTPAEAKANGCVFDLMSWCWLRPECHDDELSREMLDLGPWMWYENVEATRPVAQEVASLGERDILYVAESFHRIHCTYIWKKMHRAYRAQQHIDSYIGALNHTNHCSEILLRQGVPWNLVDTSVVLKYPTCDEIQASQA